MRLLGALGCPWARPALIGASLARATPYDPGRWSGGSSRRLPAQVGSLSLRAFLQ